MRNGIRHSSVGKARIFIIEVNSLYQKLPQCLLSFRSGTRPMGVLLSGCRGELTRMDVTCNMVATRDVTVIKKKNKRKDVCFACFKSFKSLQSTHIYNLIDTCIRMVRVVCHEQVQTCYTIMKLLEECINASAFFFNYF